MNLVFLGIIIFIVVVIVLSYLGKSDPKKISKGIRYIIICFSVILGLILILAGRFLFAIPLFFLILPIIKLKSGISILKALQLFRLIYILRQQGRYSFRSGANTTSSSNLTLEEAYSILGLKRGCTKTELNKNFSKIMEKLHPDKNKDFDATRLAQITSEARDKILKEDFKN